MKIVIFFVLCFIAIAMASQLPECPVPDPINDPFDVKAYLPNPDDCTTYYRCVNRVPILQNCAPGLWFHPDMRRCDWPQWIPEGVCKPPSSA